MYDPQHIPWYAASKGEFYMLRFSIADAMQRARQQYSIGFYRWHGPEIEAAKPNWEDIHTTNNLPTGTCAPV